MEPTRAQRAQIFWLTWLTYGAYYLCRRPFFVAKATIGEQYGLGVGALGNLETGYLVAYAAGQFASGLVCDRTGPRRFLGLGMLGVAITSVGFGLGNSVAVFAVAFTLHGLFQATGWPAVVKAMTAMYVPGQRGTVMGLWATCYQAGAIVATGLASTLLGHYGWRCAFFVPAALVAAVGVAVWLLLWEAPPGPPAVRRRVARELPRHPLLWCLGAAYFCIKLIRYCIFSWLPYFYATVLHYDKSRAGWLSTSFEIGGVVGAILGGRLFDLTGRLRGWLIVALALALAASSLVYPRTALFGTAAAFAGMVLVGFLLFGPDALVSSVAAQDLGGPEGAATAAGFINGVGSIGPIFQGALVAYVTTTFGWDALFYVFGCLAVVAAVAVVPYAVVARRTSDVAQGSA